MGINPGGNNALFICHKSWPHIVYWAGQDFTPALPLANSPSAVFCMCTYQNCLMAAIDGTNSIRFSDPANVFNWPADSEISIDTKWGHITNLVSIDDKVLIFCEKGVLYLTGDLLDSPYVGVLHPEIGAQRRSAAQYGSNVVFLFGQNLYSIDGAINLLSDSIRDNLPTELNTQLAVNDSYVYVCPPLTSGEGADMYVFEKLRLGFWEHQTYSTATGVGGTNSGYASAPAEVKYISYPWDCFAIAGLNGNLYIQPLFDKDNVVGSNDVTPDGLSTVPVLSKIESRFLDFSDRILTKKFRRGLIYGEGENIVVKLHLVDNNKNVITVTPTLSSTTLPCQFSLPVSDGTLDSPPTEFQELAFYIEGTNLLLQQVSLEFKSVRYNLLNFE